MPGDSDNFLAGIRATARRARFIAHDRYESSRYVVTDTLRNEIVSEHRSSSAAIRAAIKLNMEDGDAR